VTILYNKKSAWGRSGPRALCQFAQSGASKVVNAKPRIYPPKGKGAEIGKFETKVDQIGLEGSQARIIVHSLKKMQAKKLHSLRQSKISRPQRAGYLAKKPPIEHYVLC
jgi:hypothetical protein